MRNTPLKHTPEWETHPWMNSSSGPTSTGLVVTGSMSTGVTHAWLRRSWHIALMLRCSSIRWGPPRGVFLIQGCVSHSGVCFSLVYSVSWFTPVDIEPVTTTPVEVGPEPKRRGHTEQPPLELLHLGPRCADRVRTVPPHAAAETEHLWAAWLVTITCSCGWGAWLQGAGTEQWCTACPGSMHR